MPSFRIRLALQHISYPLEPDVQPEIYFWPAMTLLCDHGCSGEDDTGNATLSACVPAESGPGRGPLQRSYAAGRHNACSIVHAMISIASSSDLPRPV
jgi:hypothetical protein